MGDLAIVHGIFADRLPPREPTFRELIERAFATSVADHDALADPMSSEELLDATDNAAFDARQALLDHLFTVHGIGRALASKLGEVL